MNNKPLGNKPINKVYGGAAGGALAVVVAWGWELYSGQPMPAEVAAALVVLLPFVIGYFVPMTERELKQIKDA